MTDRPKSSEVRASPPSPSVASPANHPFESVNISQMLIELQKDVTEIKVTMGGLVKNVDAHDEKLDEITHQASFIKGALWVSGVIISLGVLMVGWYIQGRFSAVFDALAKLAR